jgi:tetratricopeptide (TPR) repeat protein
LFHYTRSVHLRATGRLTEAYAELCRSLELNPNLLPAYWVNMGWRLSRGMEQEELACAEELYRLAPHHPIGIGYLAGMLTRTGDATRGRQLLREIESGRGYVHPPGLAIYCLLVSEVETAVDWMERAIEQRVPQVAVIEPCRFTRRCVPARAGRGSQG